MSRITLNDKETLVNPNLYYRIRESTKGEYVKYDGSWLRRWAGEETEEQLFFFKPLGDGWYHISCKAYPKLVWTLQPGRGDGIYWVKLAKPDKDPSKYNRFKLTAKNDGSVRIHEATKGEVIEISRSALGEGYLARWKPDDSARQRYRLEEAGSRTSDRFVFDLLTNPDALKLDTPAGELRSANRDNFTELSGMSINYLSLKPGTLRRPHWHPRSHEMVYVISGRGLFGLRGPGQDLALLEAKEGDIVFIPQNYQHYFKSIDPNEELKVLAWFNSVKSGSLELNSALTGIPLPERAQTYGVQHPEKLKDLSPDTVQLIPGEIDDEPITLSEGNFQFNLQEEGRLLFGQEGVGEIKAALNPSSPQNFVKFQRLEGLCLAHIKLEPGAMRQAHWHTRVNELNYVLKGQGEFSIVSPGGKQYLCQFGPGDLMIFPVGWSHHIKNTGDEDLEFLLGFDHEAIDSIDARQSLDAKMMPDSILTQTLNIAAEVIPQASRSNFPPLVGPIAEADLKSVAYQYAGDIFP